ncbi:MAG TPA: mechanosensitive ion channel family protein [Aquifex aeolicus]|uniref:Mechanosensitive ion channel family protein n=1 Tax=Aquifex aeolicus TaxID=63363 RepID=A0A7C5QFW1_AQUAO|nr:mechanosensitive ion channel family protein [Aquifex aeolicus]
MEELTRSLGELQDYLNYVIFGVPLYRLALSLLVFFLFLFFRKLFVLILLRSVRRLTRRTATEIDDIVLRVLSKPVSFLIVVGGVFLSLRILGLENEIVARILRTLVIFVISWTAYNLVVALESQFFRFAEKFGRDFAKEVGGFLIKISKAFVITVGSVAVLQEWGINVSALLASLGLGGLAFALAAKDTAANLFGGLTVLADKSMKVGDWVKIGDVEGIVEDIGLRTTKIRSFEKSLFTVPNQVLASQPLENFSRRNVRRIKMTVGVTYSTSRDQMVRILEEIREMLRNHPRIAKDQLLMVYFTDFGDSSLDIFIYCFTDTANWAEYLSIREDVNLRIMEIVERNGSSFAFPSRSIYVEKLPTGEPADSISRTQDRKSS